MIIWIMLGIALLAIVSGNRGLYLVAGLGVIVYGFSYDATSLWYSVVIVLAGFFLFMAAFVKRSA